LSRGTGERAASFLLFERPKSTGANVSRQRAKVRNILKAYHAGHFHGFLPSSKHVEKCSKASCFVRQYWTSPSFVLEQYEQSTSPQRRIRPPKLDAFLCATPAFTLAFLKTSRQSLGSVGGLGVDGKLEEGTNCETEPVVTGVSKTTPKNLLPPSLSSVSSLSAIFTMNSSLFAAYILSCSSKIWTASSPSVVWIQ
ncbi:hypothetical protein CPB86DRAFT_782440, partial [Serendipita vermifera]